MATKDFPYFDLDLQELPIYCYCDNFPFGETQYALTENQAYDLGVYVYLDSSLESGVIHTLKMCETLMRLRSQELSWQDHYESAEKINRDSIGHVCELTKTDDSYLFGVIACIMFLNRKLANMGLHFGLEFDGDSNWIKVYLQW